MSIDKKQKTKKKHTNKVFHEFDNFKVFPIHKYIFSLSLTTAIKLLGKPKTQLNPTYASGRHRAIQENMSVDPYTQGVEESIPQTVEKVPGQPPSRLVTQTDCPHHPTARKRESISTALHHSL